MTMYDGRTILSRQVVEEVGKYFPEQVYETKIPRTIRIGEAPSHGRTIFEHDPAGQGSASYGSLGPAPDPNEVAPDMVSQAVAAEATETQA